MSKNAPKKVHKHDHDNEMKIYVGVDVSKNTLETSLKTCPQARNDEPGFAQIMAALAMVEGTPHVVMESTGGYEKAFAEALIQANIRVSVVDARQVHHLGKCLNYFAKTDKIDAQLLAQFGSTRNPRIYIMTDELTQELDALVRRRRDLVDMRSKEQTRKKQLHPRVRESICSVIDCLDKQIKEIDKDVAELIKQNEKLTAKAKILRSVKGVGPILTAILLSLLPELGVLSSKEIAALVGLAPYNHDSGQHKGRRHIFGGRQSIRDVLYMATMSAILFNPRLRAFYLRLVERGKDKKVAHIAAARKLLSWLNTMIKKNQSWDENLALAP